MAQLVYQEYSISKSKIDALKLKLMWVNVKSKIPWKALLEKDDTFET